MDDREIIDLYWNRDQKAIHYTTQKYEKYCYSIAYKILNNNEDSEECVNDTWKKTWDSIPPNKPNKFKLFLARITRNLAIDILRANLAQKRYGKESQLALEELSECICAGNDLCGELEAKELEKRIERFVNELPEREGNIFARRYFFNNSIKEISDGYGLTTHNVSVILQRTRNKLKNYLIEEGFINE